MWPLICCVSFQQTKNQVTVNGSLMSLWSQSYQEKGGKEKRPSMITAPTFEKYVEFFCELEAKTSNSFERKSPSVTYSIRHAGLDLRDAPT